MKNYLKLHRLAFRKSAANASVRYVAEIVRDLQERVQSKEQYLQSFQDARVSYREGDKKERSLEILKAELELLIAVRDIASEELSRLQLAYDNDMLTFQRLYDYLDEHREYIPEGMPNGL